jgi:hypothetical protein
MRSIRKSGHLYTVLFTLSAYYEGKYRFNAAEAHTGNPLALLPLSGALSGRPFAAGRQAFLL